MKYSFNFQSVLVPQLIKPLAITCGLMFFHRFSGVAAFNFYAVDLFRAISSSESSPSINPHFAAVATGFVQLVAASVSGLLCDLVGRLPLLAVSTALMSAALAGFGFFAYYQEAVRAEGLAPSSELDWIPLVCVIVFVCAFSLGLNPISWLLVGEMFPLEYRSVGPSLATGFSYVCAFVAVKTFVDFREHLGLYGTFWTYAGISTLGIAFSLLYVPETRGRTLDEMEPKSNILVDKEEPKV